MKYKISFLLFTCAICFASCSSDSSESFWSTSSQQMNITSVETEVPSASSDDNSDVPDTVPDHEIYNYLDALFQSSDNPSNWSDDQIGLSGISNIDSDEYKAVVSEWNEKVAEYEESCMQQCAEEFNISIDEVEAAYYRELSK